MGAHIARSTMPNTAGFAHPARNVAALGVEPGMTIADFGSGSGAYVMEMAQRMAGSGRVYAIDIQKDLLRRIHNDAQKKGLSTVHILWGDLERPQGSKLASASCDIVLVSNLLFQVENKDALLAEAKRVLKPRGKLAIIDWSESPPAGGWRMGPIKSHVVSKDAALAIAKDAGFGTHKEFDAGAHHYGLVFKIA
ncbi:methyltransferase domain-containing protein [Candidatus Kaiserbacteria bacterium]|nr:methyltransferase domain-containing protein [Candidatus Kaiserbacteria bacterium]